MCFETLQNLERCMQALQRAWHAPPTGIKERTVLMHSKEGAGNNGRAPAGVEAVYLVFSTLQVEAL